MKKDKKEKLASGGNVKVIRFLPSLRELYMVVGEKEEYVVSLDPLFCTCRAFYFKNLKATEPEKCIHIEALEEALKKGSYMAIIAHDEEMSQIFKYLLHDVLKK
jgi:predicted nucleic acid-binding Zn finger protein